MTRFDRYLMSETMRRLAPALGVVLLVLLLERTVRLFEFAAANGAAISTVLQMTASLVPHYLGLALPAAFFISILLVIARLGDDSELDAMMSAGLSMRRLARPLILAGVLLTGFSVLLYGWVEPYSRYGYRALKYAATHGAWIDSLQARTFFTPLEDLTIYAGRVDLNGRDLGDVFVRQIDETGSEVVTTAATGRLDVIDNTNMAQVTLQDVVQVVIAPDSKPVAMRLSNFQVDPTFPVEPRPFRARGGEVRELTLIELWEARAEPDVELVPPPDAAPAPMPGMGHDAQADVTLGLPGTPATRASELHGRLTASFSILLMPFLAIPMGMAAKRQRRGVAIAVAAVVLVVYRHALELGGGLVGTGTLTPWLGYWAPFAAFTVVALALFGRVDWPPRQSGFDLRLGWLTRGLEGLTRRRRRAASP